MVLVAAGLGTLVAPSSSVAEDARDRVKVALVAMHSEMGRPEENLARVAEFCDKAHAAGATFVVFPEECLTGSLNKSNLSEAEQAKAVASADKLAIARLTEIARKNRQTLIVGTILRDGEKYRNAALVVGPDGPLATFSKLWLPNKNEERFFRAGNELPVVQSQGWQFSVGICADLNRGEYFDAASRAGAEMFLLPVAGSGMGEVVGANGDQTKQADEHRKLHEPIMRDWGRQYAIYVGYANQAGHSGNDWFPGLSLAVDPRGELMAAHAPTEGMLVVEVSRDVLKQARAALKRSATAPEIKNSSGQPVRILRVGK